MGSCRSKTATFGVFKGTLFVLLAAWFAPPKPHPAPVKEGGGPFGAA